MNEAQPLHVDRRSSGLTWRLLPHVLLPLLVGGLIYLAWRSQTLLMFRWAEVTGLNVEPLRSTLCPFAPASDLLLFSVSNAL